MMLVFKKKMYAVIAVVIITKKELNQIDSGCNSLLQ